MVSLPPTRTTELFYDGQWNAISLRESTALTIERGVSSEGSRAEPMAAAATVDNRSGDYSPRNPNSPLYGKIGRNTPIRHSVDAGGPWLALPGDTTSALTTPDSAVLGVTDLDVRIEVALDDYSVTQELVSRFVLAGDNCAWSFKLTSGQPQLTWYPDGTFGSVLVAGTTVLVPVHAGQRIALRATLDVNNGSGGHLVSFYWARSLNATTWHLIDTDTGGAGTTTLFDGTAGIQLGTNTGLVGTGIQGNVYGMQLMAGIDGAAVVDLDIPRDAELTDTSFADDTSLVWTLAGSAALSNRHVRMVGEVPAWPPQRDLSGNDRTTTIAPAGIMRRLGAGNKPLDSALMRFIRANGPIECWPLTDGKLATSGASLVGGTPMVPRIDFGTAPVQWGAGTLAGWIEPVARFPAETDGVLRGTVPDSVDAATGWSVDMFVSGMGTEQDLLITDRGGGVVGNPRQTWYLAIIPASNEITLTGSSGTDVSSSSSLLTTITSAGIFDDQPHHIRLTVTPGGSNTAWAVYLDGVSRASGTYAPIGKAVLTIQPGWWASLVTDGTGSNGYVTYWSSTAPSAAEMYEAFLGYPGEAAGTRVLRVAAEAGVAVSMFGVASEQTRMGFQGLETMLDTLDTAAKSDLGYVIEQRDARALIYRGRATLYNQDPVLTLDFTDGVIGKPFRPTDDDKLTQNDVAVTREGGATKFAVLEEGRMSVQDPPDGVGRYDVAHTRSLEDDDQPEQIAGWMLHLGTVDGLRYTQLTLHLGTPRVYAMVDDILRADVGDKIRITNLPAEYGPDDVDLIIRGYSEELSEQWSITFNCAPGGAWSVLELDSGETSRLDTAGSELAVAVDTDDTTLIVATTQGPIWADSPTYPDDFPIDLHVGGEEVTASAITGAIVDAFGRTTANGWGSADVGGAWTTGGGSASNYSVGSGVGSHTLATVNVSRRTTLTQPAADFDVYASLTTSATATGGSIFGGIIARVVDGDNLYMARAEFTTANAIILTIRERAAAAEATLGSAFTSTLTHVPGTLLRMRFQGSGTTLRAKVWLASATEPGAWQIDTTDATLTAAGLMGCRSILAAGNTNVNPAVRYDNLLLANPQAMTVTRSTNGIVKSHAVGTLMQLARPNFIPL